MDMAEKMFNISGVPVECVTIYKKNKTVDFKVNGGKGNKLTVMWEIPFVDMMYAWHPTCETKRLSVPRNTESIFSISAPMFCIYNGRKENKYTVAVSEIKECVELNGNIIEETGCLRVEVIVPLINEETEFSIYIDNELKSFEQAIDAVRIWWENDCGILPMQTPNIAKLPMYSTWYSFHQNISDEKLKKEAELAKKLGFSAIIVDDGWQCDDKSRGYAYCGDWKPAESKIPDMKKHIEDIHHIGLKYLLWFSVPFVGKYSQKYAEFKDMQLYYMEDMDAAVLDPRYETVRTYLTDTYKNALTEWKLDGFKLDFIDCFVNRDNVPYNDKMDCESVQEGVDRLLRDIKQTLTEINPNIMIEFRQRYIGPGIRQYGNMLRVVDCPNTYVSNRVGTLDLRLMSGKTAVHSDMLMWNSEECVKNAAIQIINIIFSTMQFSVNLESLSDEHVKMLAFWMNFMARERELLLESPVTVYDPQSLYTAASVCNDEKSIIAVYNGCKSVNIQDTVNEVVLINGSQSESIIICTDREQTFKFVIKNCVGDIVADYEKHICDEVYKVAIPSGGMAEIRRQFN